MNMIEHPQLKAYQLKPPTLKHVENINVSDKLRYDRSLKWS